MFMALVLLLWPTLGQLDFMSGQALKVVGDNLQSPFQLNKSVLKMYLLPATH